MKHPLRYTRLKALSYSLTAVTIVLSAPLLAETGSEPANIYGAFADFCETPDLLNSPTCNMAYVNGYASREEANQRAIEKCGLPGCEVFAELTNACGVHAEVAHVWEHNGETMNYSFYFYTDQSDAEAYPVLSDLQAYLLDACENYQREEHGQKPGYTFKPCSIVESSCPSTVVVPDITGIWNSSDYECNGEAVAQTQIRIEKHGDVFSAIKLNGDKCLPAGYETFLWDTKRNVCKILLKDPDGSFEYGACTVETLGKNDFKVVIPTNATVAELSFKKEGELPAQEEIIDISGNWVAEYDCFGVEKPERVKVEKNGAVFAGIKLEGDDCVPAGYVTFYWDSSRDSCRIATASETALLPSNFEKCSLSITDANHFTLRYSEYGNWPMDFRREGGASQFPAVVSENLDIKIPYAEYRSSRYKTKLLKGKLKFVPKDDGALWWKLQSNEFLSEDYVSGKDYSAEPSGDK